MDAIDLNLTKFQKYKIWCRVILSPKNFGHNLWVDPYLIRTALECLWEIIKIPVKMIWLLLLMILFPLIALIFTFEDNPASNRVYRKYMKKPNNERNERNKLNNP